MHTLNILADTTETVATSGISLGSALAIVCSWERNRSILWALLAGILTWFYVLYFALTRKPEETRQGKWLELDRQ